MSESLGGAQPAAPAAPPAGGDVPFSPAPDTQPGISISEAGRLLRSRRNQPQAGPPAQAPAARAGEPTPQPDTGAPKPAEGDAPKAEGDATKVGRGVSAMEAALGIKPVEGGEAPATPEPPGALGAELELDGRRWSQEQLREQIRLAADYTQKTQAVAQLQRELQSQQQALAQFLPHIQPEVEALQRKLAENPRPDPMLRQTDPGRYWEQFAAWQDSLAEQQRFLQVQQLQQQARDAAMTQAVEQGNAQLAAKYPFWADPAQRAEVQQEIVRWALAEGGYTKEELRGLTSPKHLETLMKASMFDKWVKGARTAAPQPRMTGSPRGAAPPPPASASLSAAQEAFDQKPSVKNAAALLTARRAGNGTASQW